MGCWVEAVVCKTAIELVVSVSWGDGWKLWYANQHIIVLANPRHVSHFPAYQIVEGRERGPKGVYEC